MTENMKRLFRREDYRPYPFTIEKVELDITLDPETSVVTNNMVVTPKALSETTDMVFDADDIAFERLFINGAEADDSRYELSGTTLTVKGITEQTKLTIVNRFSPARNTKLSGIYMSNGAFMSQCESQGFRRITYWPDRPDVMSRFTVTVHAKQDACPVLLSNGNLVASGAEENGRHWARFVDPHKKPSYLFALVAGDFMERFTDIVLKNGRTCHLSVWTETKNYARSAHALESLEQAIRWDEERFGLELDLDRFGIVATDDFNFGAMENKGLNIFNSRYVMASPDIATDKDYEAITSVVGHEYFHNWTGDRVTVRDWFQITLKEGLTTFRDQEFSMDLAPDAMSRSVLRIEDVRALRLAQFPEDAGPMAHPIRPDAYQEVDNFYTMTVYEKGAEVVRMLQTMFGREGFRAGLQTFIATYDGQAATCDDFLEAMGRANGTDLTKFARWYAQAGTPRVTIETAYNPEQRTFTLKASQHTPPTPGQHDKLPFVIPIAVGLIGADGRDMPLTLEGENPSNETTRVLTLTEPTDEWTFVQVNENPVVSIGRDFSAPVIFDTAYTREELAFLAQHDSDGFNRYEAMRRLVLEVLNEMVDEAESGRQPQIAENWLRTFGAILDDQTLSPAFRAVILALPDERTLAMERALINPDSIHIALKAAKAAIGDRYSQELQNTVRSIEEALAGTYSPDAASAGKRALRNLLLDFWLTGGSARALLTAKAQFEKAQNLTDKLAALRMIVRSQSPVKSDVLNAAASAWYQEPLLLNKWFAVQACAHSQADEGPVVQVIKAITDSQVFSLKNPNNVWALLRTFFNDNLLEFHRLDGSGYALWAEMVLKTDKLNPHVAARLARALDHWRRFEPKRAKMMYEALTKVAAEPTLSAAVSEIVGKALNNQ